MAKIEALENAVEVLNHEGYCDIADELFEEVQRIKRNNQKQKERRKGLIAPLNNIILRIITQNNLMPLSSKEIFKELVNRGITLNPATNKPLTPRSISIICSNMRRNGLIYEQPITEKVTVNRKVSGFYR